MHMGRGNAVFEGGPFACVVGKARVEADEAETKLTRSWTSHGYYVVYNFPFATEMNIGIAWA